MYVDAECLEILELVAEGWDTGRVERIVSTFSLSVSFEKKACINQHTFIM